MVCINQGNRTICNPPYTLEDNLYPMLPTAAEDDGLVCGTSSVVLILAGLGIGWLVADKFASYSKTGRL